MSELVSDSFSFNRKHQQEVDMSDLFKRNPQAEHTWINAHIDSHLSWHNFIFLALMCGRSGGGWQWNSNGFDKYCFCSSVKDSQCEAPGKEFETYSLSEKSEKNIADSCQVSKWFWHRNVENLRRCQAASRISILLVAVAVSTHFCQHLINCIFSLALLHQWKSTLSFLLC